ncbi:MAG: hypothetical protein HQK55_00065 [Deltaproteobacteria bacterium]|nr:hypothetical protein [Deltaproteobacteria bacterium]
MADIETPLIYSIDTAWVLPLMMAQAHRYIRYHSFIEVIAKPEIFPNSPLACPIRDLMVDLGFGSDLEGQDFEAAGIPTYFEDFKI